MGRHSECPAAASAKACSSRNVRAIHNSYVLKSTQDIIMSVNRRSINDFVAEFRIQEQHPLLLKNHRRILRLSRENINLAELDAELWALKVRLKRFI